jgi:hypothetical protein
MPRIDRSTVLLLSSMRPSLMKRVSSLPAGERVANGFGELDLLADQSELGAQPGFKGVDQRPALLLSREAALFRAAAADFFLDRVDGGDVLQRLAGDGCRAGCREFVEVPPHVHPAECELDLAAIGKLWISAVTIDLQEPLKPARWLNSRSALRSVA